MRTMLRTRGAAAAAVAVLAVTGAVQAAPTASGATAPKAFSATLAPGVTFSRTNFTLTEGKHRYPEQALTLSVTLSAHTSLVATYPGNRVSKSRATLVELAQQEHAIGGVSGNVYIDKDPHAAGDGGVTYRGTIVKSELKGKDDSLWVDGSGRAHIGDPGFDGQLTTGSHHIHVSSVNYVDNAAKGAVTILDYHEAPIAVPKCLIATMKPTGTDRYLVTKVLHNASHFDGVSGATKALMSCGSHQVPWLTTFLKAGVTLTGSWGYASRGVTLMSGANHILRAGKAYHDPSGIPVSTDWFQVKRVPEDFACVMKDTRHVLLGSIVGWQSYSAGMTYVEMANYLAKRGCQEAIALNPLYQSTTVAKLPGKAVAVQNPRTSEGVKKILNGLLVTTH